jgi:hypothetical protein
MRVRCFAVRCSCRVNSSKILAVRKRLNETQGSCIEIFVLTFYPGRQEFARSARALRAFFLFQLDFPRVSKAEAPDATLCRPTSVPFPA